MMISTISLSILLRHGVHPPTRYLPRNLTKWCHFWSRRYILTWNYAVRPLKIRPFQQETSIPTYSKYPFSAALAVFFQGDPTCSKAQNLFSMFNFLGGWIRDTAPKTRQFEDPQNWDCDILRAIKLLLQGIEASVVAAVGQLGSCWWWVLDGLDGRFEQKNTVQNSMSFIHGSSDLPPTHGKWVVTWGEMGAATYKSYK